jgi:hypothetical protein
MPQRFRSRHVTLELDLGSPWEAGRRTLRARMLTVSQLVLGRPARAAVRPRASNGWRGLTMIARSMGKAGRSTRGVRGVGEKAATASNRYLLLQIRGLFSEIRPNKPGAHFFCAAPVPKILTLQPERKLPWRSFWNS